jgi:hypothetical protein
VPPRRSAARTRRRSGPRASTAAVYTNGTAGARATATGPIGRIMARSGLFSDITRASQAVVKIIAGREPPMGPFAAMSDIHIVDGTPVDGASSLVRQSRVYDYRVVEWTNERCAIDFYRHGEKLEPTVTFDDDGARRAGLDQPRADARPSSHTRFPRNMKSRAR